MWATLSRLSDQVMHFILQMKDWVRLNNETFVQNSSQRHSCLWDYSHSRIPDPHSGRHRWVTASILDILFMMGYHWFFEFCLVWVVSKEGAPPVHPSHSTENSLWFGWHHHNGMVGRGKSTIIQWPVHVLSVKWIFKQSQPEEETNTKFALSHFQFTYLTCLLKWCGINNQHKWQ